MICSPCGRLWQIGEQPAGKISSSSVFVLSVVADSGTRRVILQRRSCESDLIFLSILISSFFVPSSRHSTQMSLRALSLRRLPRYSALARPFFSRTYATPGSPKPSRNPPPPPGLESVFGGSAGKQGTTVAPKPPGVGPPSGPSLPKKPDVGLPGLEGEENRPEDQKEQDEPRRPKLSEQLSGKAGKRVTTGGGGGSGGSGGGAGGPGGQPGGFGGMTPNQLLLLAVSTYALWSMTAPDDVRTKEITWQEL